MRCLFAIVFLSIIPSIAFSAETNKPPNRPSPPSGPVSAQIYDTVTFTTTATDPDGDSVSIRFDWGDGNISSWSPYVASGQTVSMSHVYTSAGTYFVKVQAKDKRPKPYWSAWSEPHKIEIEFFKDKWSYLYGGKGAVAHSVEQTEDGGYIVAGYIYNDATKTDVYLIKVAPNGDIEWTKTYGGEYYDKAFSLELTNDGGYIIVGYTESFGAGNNDVCLIKVASDGDIEWIKTYGGKYDDEGYSVKQTEDGGYIIVGQTRSFGAGKLGGYLITTDVYLIKTDANGNIEWTKTYGGSKSDMGFSVEQTADGGYIIAGRTESFGVVGGAAYLIKTDANGNLIWDKVYTDFVKAYSVKQTKDEGYIITGLRWGGNIYLLKTDPYGNAEWTKTYGTGCGKSLELAKDGGYIIAGFTESLGVSRIYLLKTDADGNVKWEKTYDRGIGHSVKQTKDGGYIIAGESYSSDRGKQVILIKTDANGNYK